MQFGRLEFGGWGFLITVYCESLPCDSSLVTLLSSGNSPTFDFVKATDTGKLWPQSRADLLVDKTGIKLSLLKLEETQY